MGRRAYQPPAAPAKCRLAQASAAADAPPHPAAAALAGWRVSSSVWRRIASRTRSSRRITPAQGGVRPRKAAQARASVA